MAKPYGSLYAFSAAVVAPETYYPYTDDQAQSQVFITRRSLALISPTNMGEY